MHATGDNDIKRTEPVSEGHIGHLLSVDVRGCLPILPVGDFLSVFLQVTPHVRLPSMARTEVVG